MKWKLGKGTVTVISKEPLVDKWTDFDGLMKLYNEDFEETKSNDNSVTELEFLTFHVLPQFERIAQEAFSFPEKLAYQRFLKFLYQRKKHLEKPEASKKSQLVSYKWHENKFSCLSKLFTAIKGKLIDKDIQNKQFKAIFNGNPVNEITPVKWHDENATELLYFITELMEKGYIPKEKRMNYKRLKMCFVKNDGKPFTENFKEIKQNLEINLADGKQVFIGKILSSLHC